MNAYHTITPDGWSPELGAYVLDDGHGHLVTIPTTD